MKMINSILGCALATGLMVFASSQTQASPAATNGIYAPIKLKLMTTFKDSKGNVKTATIVTKQILADLNQPKNVELVFGIAGTTNDGDVYIYNPQTKTTVKDLTSASILTVNETELFSTIKEKNNGSTSTSNGTIDIAFYDNPFTVFGFDQGASRSSSANWFEVSGVYSAKESETSPNNGPDNVISASAKAFSLSGQGAFTPNSTTPKSSVLPVTGSGSAKGSGKLPRA